MILLEMDNKYGNGNGDTGNWLGILIECVKNDCEFWNVNYWKFMEIMCEFGIWYDLWYFGYC